MTIKGHMHGQMQGQMKKEKKLQNKNNAPVRPWQISREITLKFCDDDDDDDHDKDDHDNDKDVDKHGDGDDNEDDDNDDALSNANANANANVNANTAISDMNVKKPAKIADISNPNECILNVSAHQSFVLALQSGIPDTVRAALFCIYAMTELSSSRYFEKCVSAQPANKKISCRFCEISSRSSVLRIAREMFLKDAVASIAHESTIQGFTAFNVQTMAKDMRMLHECIQTLQRTRVKSNHKYKNMKKMYLDKLFIADSEVTSTKKAMKDLALQCESELQDMRRLIEKSQLIDQTYVQRLEQTLDDKQHKIQALELELNGLKQFRLEVETEMVEDSQRVNAMQRKIAELKEKINSGNQVIQFQSKCLHEYRLNVHEMTSQHERDKQTTSELSVKIQEMEAHAQQSAIDAGHRMQSSIQSIKEQHNREMVKFAREKDSEIARMQEAFDVKFSSMVSRFESELQGLRQDRLDDQKTAELALANALAEKNALQQQLKQSNDAFSTQTDQLEQVFAKLILMSKAYNEMDVKNKMNEKQTQSVMTSLQDQVRELDCKCVSMQSSHEQLQRENDKVVQDLQFALNQALQARLEAEERHNEMYSALQSKAQSIANELQDKSLLLQQYNDIATMMSSVTNRQQQQQQQQQQPLEQHQHVQQQMKHSSTSTSTPIFQHQSASTVHPVSAVPSVPSVTSVASVFNVVSTTTTAASVGGTAAFSSTAIQTPQGHANTKASNIISNKARNGHRNDVVVDDDDDDNNQRQHHHHNLFLTPLPVPEPSSATTSNESNIVSSINSRKSKFVNNVNDNDNDITIGQNIGLTFTQIDAIANSPDRPAGAYVPLSQSNVLTVQKHNGHHDHTQKRMLNVLQSPTSPFPSSSLLSVHTQEASQQMDHGHDGAQIQSEIQSQSQEM
jgi:myosin heavy subunit